MLLQRRVPGCKELEISAKLRGKKECSVVMTVLTPVVSGLPGKLPASFSLGRSKVPGSASLHVDEGPLDQGIICGANPAFVARVRDVICPAVIAGIAIAAGMVLKPPIALIGETAARR